MAPSHPYLFPSFYTTFCVYCVSQSSFFQQHNFTDLVLRNTVRCAPRTVEFSDPQSLQSLKQSSLQVVRNIKKISKAQSALLLAGTLTFFHKIQLSSPLMQWGALSQLSIFFSNQEQVRFSSSVVEFYIFQFPMKSSHVITYQPAKLQV